MAASLTIAALALAVAPLADRSALADAIQSAARVGKLTWRTPDVAGDAAAAAPQTSSAQPVTGRNAADVFDRQTAESAAPAATVTSASYESSANSQSGSTLRVKTVSAEQSLDVRNRHTLKSSRLDRAARPYSSSLIRGYGVQRLNEADPSSFSGGTIDPNSGSLSIRRVSGVDEVGPELAPEEGQPQQVSRENESIDQAGLQEGGAQRSPFENEQPAREPDQFNPPAREQGAQSGLLPGRCPTPRDLKPLDQISINIAAEPGPFPAECGLGDETFVPRDFACTTYAWKASSLCHKPLYFEDWDLERYGHTASPLLQPFISAAQFYLVLPILPYKMGLEPPGECIYALGYYRPGSCAPRIIPNVPISLRAGLLEAGVWVAGVALVP
jgi:hypothetical protein